ncbi:hypothetical protein B0H11DRAFT_1103101 [Mycena galericulata]|nr:hypothetical protein B0H11DRAFT_1103101 [Mycena galericulata]
MFLASPLEPHIVITILHYISPTIQPFPQHLLASQLAFRQSCLKLTPDDPAYLFWPSADDQRVTDALESFQQTPIDDLHLDFQIKYTADDSLFAHVQLTPGLRLVFQWEEGAWKYSNAAPMPFPPNSSASLEDLPEPQPVDDGSGDETPDSYWDSYGEPHHQGAGPEAFEREDSSTTGSYWDMYNSVQGSGDSVIPSPAPEKQRHDLLPISFSYADMHPATDPIESLSDRLEALARRPNPPDEDAVTVVVPLPSATRDTPEVDALKEGLRGLYRLWKKAAPRPELFLSIVHEVLAEP